MKYWNCKKIKGFGDLVINTYLGILQVENPNKKCPYPSPQNMRCTMCHMTSQTSNNNSTTNFGKAIISYTLSHKITTMKKHVANEHIALVQYIKHTKVLDGTIIGQPKKKTKTK
jgi:hypothetical protein